MSGQQPGALVLVQELEQNPDLPSAMSAFMQRRLERARMVVMNSLKLGELEMAGAPMPEQGALMQQSTQAICAPY